MYVRPQCTMSKYLRSNGESPQEQGKSIYKSLCSSIRCWLTAPDRGQIYQLQEQKMKADHMAMTPGSNRNGRKS